MDFSNIHIKRLSPIFMIVLAAFSIRLIVVLLLSPPLLSDEIDYYHLGQSIVNENSFSLDGIPTASRAPGYPIIIASIISLFGNSIGAMRVFQALVDSVTCFLVFTICRNSFSLKTAYLATIVYALFPGSMFYILFLMTETIFTGVLMIAIFLASSRRLQDSTILRLLLGAVLGILTLIKPNAAILFLIFLAWEWFRSRSVISTLRKYLLVCIGFVLLISPWIIRNKIQFDRLSLTSNGGVNFWIGHNEQATGSFRYVEKNNPLENVKGEFERSQFALREGLSYLATHPLQEIKLICLKSIHFFEPDFGLMQSLFYREEWKTYSRALHIYREFPPLIFVGFHFLTAGIVLLALWSFIFTNDSTLRNITLIKMVIIGWICFHLIFFTVARYRIPMMPAMIILAAYSIESWNTKSYTITTLRKYFFIITSVLLISSWIYIFGIIYVRP